ncbi:MAG: hypothetical protein ACRD4P_18085 [Bryobacteraceae bacterium]
MILDRNSQALRKMNERNHDFWSKQAQLTAERMTDETLLRFAIDAVSLESMRGVPVYSQQSIDQILNDLVSFKESIHKAFSEKGGRVSKTDALQRAILKIASRNPKITLEQLHVALMEKCWAKLNIEIDKDEDVLAGEDKQIHFDDINGKGKTASLPGLKDRLYRAKKALAPSR